MQRCTFTLQFCLTLSVPAVKYFVSTLKPRFQFPLGSWINFRPIIDCPVAGKWLKVDNYFMSEYGHLSEVLILRVQLTSLDVVSTETGEKRVSFWHINPLNPELNPICYLLALLAHHFLHVSRIRVKSLTFRLLMSYIYGAPILDVSRSHTTTQHSR